MTESETADPGVSLSSVRVGQASARTSELALGTLALAALGSAVATFLVGRFGLAGTITGAALTPVVIALVSELARRPARTIGVRTAGVRTAARGTQARPRTPTRTGYRAERGSSRLRRVRWGRVLAIGGAAFLVVVAGVTLADFASGGSVASERDTTFFTPREPDGGRRPSEERQQEPAPAPAEVPTETTETTEEPTTAPTVTEPPPTTTEAPPTTTDGGPR